MAQELYRTAEILKRGLTGVIKGQDSVIELLFACFFAGGHALLEGVPGLGKTLLARSLAKLTDAKYRRIQFTPDLLPSDIIGTLIFNAQNSAFSFHAGPVFTEILLADEVNRTPPKSQAALLEAMEERQISIAGLKKPLPEMFFVMATQNPVEYEGTYPLPETQLDRFMMKIPVSYPPADAELDILKFYAEGVELQQLDSLIPSPVITREEVLARRRELASVRVKDDILVYIQRLTAETRDPMYTQLGASTRAAVALLKASRALAGLRGSDFVTPDEVKDAAGAVLRHRIILRPEALIEGLTPDFHLDTVLKKIPVPR